MHTLRAFLCAVTVAFCLSLTHPSFGQLTVVQGSAMNLTPQQLVQTYLLGAGITVSNVTYNGSAAVITSNQVGTFETAGTATTELGLTGGVIMTTGKAENAIGPNNKGNAGTNTSGPGDPDLNIISGSTTHDKAVIEFDFIPQYDTVRFRYVFGSEEFFEYCSGYNDAFGFFLSGPGITGTFSNNSVNIALMPGSSSMYVTINNICNNLFSRWDNAGGVNYQYDGLTHVFTAWHVVVPCSTYHIKLAVADAADNAYDSGVFLEENSFSSPGVVMNSSGSIPALGSKAVEGCNDVAVHFQLEAPLNYPYKVNFTIGGSAQNGTDYSLLPGSVTFPPGVDSIALIIHPVLDLVAEGDESIIFTINQINCDGLVNADTVWIGDYIPMTRLYQNPDTVICHGTEMELMAHAGGGLRPYTYTWSMTPSPDSVVVFTPPVGTAPYFVRISDLCNNSVYDTAMVVVHPTPVAHPGNNTTIPFGTSTTLNGSASGGYGSYGYFWESNPPGFTSNQQNPVTGNLFHSMIYNLTVTDQASLCESDPAQVMVIVEGGPLSANPAVQPTAVCLGTSAQLFALAGGGSGIYTYQWTGPGGFTSDAANPWVTPEATSLYQVTVNDGFNQVNGNTTLTLYPLPVIHLGPGDTVVCIYDTVVLDAANPGSTYDWSNGAHTRTITVSSTGIGFETQSYRVQVTNENGCTDSADINVIFTFSACTGMEEQRQNNDLKIYPNPARERITFELAAPSDRFVATLYSTTGTVVRRLELSGAEGRLFRGDLEIAGVPPGLYLLQLSSDGFSATGRLLVAH